MVHTQLCDVPGWVPSSVRPCMRLLVPPAPALTPASFLSPFFRPSPLCRFLPSSVLPPFLAFSLPPFLLSSPLPPSRYSTSSSTRFTSDPSEAGIGGRGSVLGVPHVAAVALYLVSFYPPDDKEAGGDGPLSDGLVKTCLSFSCHVLRLFFNGEGGRTGGRGGGGVKATWSLSCRTFFVLAAVPRASL